MPEEVAELDFDGLETAEEMGQNTSLQFPEDAVGDEKAALTKRWSRCILLPKQKSFLETEKRFVVVAAGRRSFKTEGAKRRLVKKALTEYRFEDARFIAGAPTHGQARRIFWKDLKKLVPLRFVEGGLNGIRESSMTIPLINGCEICVMGMDVPERAEGSPIAHFLSDETANMKPRVWEEVISPALAETQGTADFIGVPEGRNHFYDMFKAAESGIDSEWVAYHWTAEAALPLYLGLRADRRRLPVEWQELDDIELGIKLAAREIASAKRRMDPLSYDQEFNASFVLFSGRAYYQFDSEVQAQDVLEYQSGKPLILCFDFNVEPGTATIVQEFPADYIKGQPQFTGIIGEIHIPKNSNTPLVCRSILAEWKARRKHTGPVVVYGDATGGARSTQTHDSSSNWDVVKRAFHQEWTGGVTYKIKRGNPPVLSRLNCMNSRFKSADGTISMRVCPVGAPMSIKDYDGVQLVEGGSGEIDKKIDPKLTHLSDGVGYMVEKKFPIRNQGFVGAEVY